MDTNITQNLKGYELRERIGAGGFGAVYRAYPSDGKAIKIILPGLTNQPEFIRRFEDEAQIVARLEHPHITPLYDYWRDPAGAYLVMHWLRGHVTQIYSKLGVRSRVQAMARARELNLLTKSSESLPVVHIPTEDFHPENPYKGLRAFQSADNQDFFGRETVTAKLIKRLGEAHEFGRFLAMIGPSGSGKSSLVKAELIPVLWRGDLPGSEKWFIVELMPGAHPLDELEIALTRVAALAAQGAGRCR